MADRPLERPRSLLQIVASVYANSKQKTARSRFYATARAFGPTVKHLGAISRRSTTSVLRAHTEAHDPYAVFLSDDVNPLQELVVMVARRFDHRISENGDSEPGR